MRTVYLLLISACASSYSLSDEVGARDGGVDASTPDELGEPCTPVAAPEPLFSDEVYVERGSPACVRSEACIAVRLNGSATRSREDCGAGAECRGLASREEIAERVFCSCRCAVPEGSREAPCSCGPGFFCDPRTDFGFGGTVISGAYCVRESLR